MSPVEVLLRYKETDSQSRDCCLRETGKGTTEPLRVSPKPQLKNASCRSDRGCQTAPHVQTVGSASILVLVVLSYGGNLQYRCPFPPAIVHIANVLYAFPATLGGGAELEILFVKNLCSNVSFLDIPSSEIDFVGIGVLLSVEVLCTVQDIARDIVDQKR